MLGSSWMSVEFDLDTDSLIQVDKKHSLYEEVWYHIGLKDSGGVNSTETRFDWNVTG